MLTVAIPKRNKLQNIIVLTPKDGDFRREVRADFLHRAKCLSRKASFRCSFRLPMV